MKFSISTSFYRRAHLVEQIYQQILDQTHGDWEWVVTDDFSDYRDAKDLLLEICLKDPRVKYFEQSRKKECFYNPHRGCSGDIVIQFDSDDFAYPRILEIYNHLFLKHPDVVGISCLSQTVDGDGNWVEIQGGGSYSIGETSVVNYTPMGRAWRNIIDGFDNGEMQWYQNDTNIVRHLETRGKWLYLPRTLYRYYYSQDTFSREPNRTEQQYSSIEDERFFIEGKFPWLHNPDKTTFNLYYLPIFREARAFANAEFNLASTRQKILFYKTGLKVYERQLLKELFWDHDLYFDLDLETKFDEVILLVDDLLSQQIPSIRERLSVFNKGTLLKLSLDTRESSSELLFEQMNQTFEGYGWVLGGYEMYLNTAI